MAIRYRSELIDFRGSDRYPASGRALPVSDRHASTLAQMKMRYAVLLAFLIVTSSAWSKDPTLPAEESALLFEIGSQTPTVDILKACALLCKDADLHVRFRGPEGWSSDLGMVTFKGIARLDDSFDPLKVTLKSTGPSVDTWKGEGSKYFEDKLKMYAESVGLVGERHAIILRIDDNISYTDFRNFLELLVKVFGAPVIVPDTDPSANTGRQATAPPPPAP